jgi:hypothetical protein
MNKIVSVASVNQYNHLTLFDATNQLQGIEVLRTLIRHKEKFGVPNKNLVRWVIICERGGIFQVWFKSFFDGDVF